MNPELPSILYRSCNGLEEFHACVQLQTEVWGYGDRDVVPMRVFAVAQRIGGQVMGAYDLSRPGAGTQGNPASLVGFAMALPGIRSGKLYLHSHMLAVNPAYRNQGIGRRLKLLQREDALARGIAYMEWTFDPLEIKNCFLNIARLGAVVRSYTPNFYGVSSSRLHGGIPTDRLNAEWWLDSPWVASVLGGEAVAPPTVALEIAVPHQLAAWRNSAADEQRVLDVQSNNRQQFEQAFRNKLTVFAFKIDPQGNGVFQLGRWPEPISPQPQE